MAAARRCHRIANLLKGEIGRQSRYLYKIARETGDVDEGNKLRRWICICTNGELLLPELVGPEASVAPKTETELRAPEAGPVARPSSSVPRPTTPVPVVSTGRAGLLLPAAFVLIFLVLFGMVDSAGLGEQFRTSLGTTLPLVIAAAIAAAISLEFAAAVWLRAGSRNWDLRTAAFHGIPVNFDERQRPERRDKFSRRLMPHPFVGAVRRRTDDAPFVGRQGTRGRDFPTDRSPPGAFRVLVVGGSVAEQLFSSDSGTFVSPLETALRSCETGQPISNAEVWCGAVFGWTVANFVPFSMLYGDRFDCIVSLFGINELYSRSPAETAGRVFYHSLSADDDDPNIRRIRALDVMIRDCTTSLRQPPALFANLATVHRRGRLFDLLAERAAVSRQDSKVDPGMAAGIIETFSVATGGRLAECVGHIRSLEDYCGRTDTMLINFLQPLAPFRKPLSAAERRAMELVGDRCDGYLEFVGDIRSALGGRSNVHDLTGIYEGVTETLYADECHLVVDPRTFIGPGLEILADNMARAIKESCAKPG